MFKIIAATGLIAFSITTTSPATPGPAWKSLNATPRAAPWAYKSPTEAKQLLHATHCYKWLPSKARTIKEVLKNKKKTKK
jgi:hypothetical protein